MRQVAVTEGDKVEAQIRLGVAVNGYGVTDLVDAVRSVPEADVEALTAAYDREYLVAPDLGPAGARRAELREAARIEVGLRGFLEAGGFGAFTDTFEDLDGLVQLPGIAVQRLMADGYGFGAEGDWKTAIMVRLVKTMAAGLPGGTSFMEDYTYHLDPRGRRSSAPTCWRSVRRSPATGRRARSTRSRSVHGRIPSGWSSRRRPGRRW